MISLRKSSWMIMSRVKNKFARRGDARLQAAGLDGDFEDVRFNAIASRRLLEFLWVGQTV